MAWDWVPGVGVTMPRGSLQPDAWSPVPNSRCIMWLPGPMPKGTWGWGAVKLIEQGSINGFYFADFHGDHVLIGDDKRRINADDIAYYNNSITLPPER